MRVCHVCQYHDLLDVIDLLDLGVDHLANNLPFENTVHFASSLSIRPLLAPAADGVWHQFIKPSDLLQLLACLPPRYPLR